MAEIRTITPEWSSKSVELERDIEGIGPVTRERCVRADGSQIAFTTLVAQELDNPLQANLLLDERFLSHGIETEPNGLLINQGKTKEVWGSPAGMRPEYWMDRVDDDLTPAATMIGFPATNAFWQKGEFFVKSGQVVRLPNDETLTGRFEALVLTDSGWSAKELDLVDGSSQTSIRGINIGLSMPFVVKNGLVVPQQEIVASGHKRVLADARNFVNFSAGASEDPNFNFRFFDLIRKFQPSTLSAARRITYEGGVSVVRAVVTKEEALEFKAIVEDERWKLGEHFRVAEVGDEGRPTRVVIGGPFPANRIPATIIGHTEAGKLIVGFFDGRQKDSTGVTFDEAAEIMRAKGAVNAGIGAAGGDVALVLKEDSLLAEQPNFEILNSPSNKDRRTRLAPNMLTLHVPDPAAAHLY